MSRPEDRYQSFTTKKTVDGKLVYKSLLPKKIVPNPLTDISIPASDISRMDVIANNVYGSAQDWWKIASANGKVNGSLYLTPGKKMIIPRG